MDSDEPLGGGGVYVDLPSSPSVSERYRSEYARAAKPVARPVNQAVKVVVGRSRIAVSEISRPKRGGVLRGEQPLNGRRAKPAGSPLLRQAKPVLAKPLRDRQGGLKKSGVKLVKRETAPLHRDDSTKARKERTKERTHCKLRPDGTNGSGGRTSRAFIPWCDRG